MVRPGLLPTSCALLACLALSAGCGGEPSQAPVGRETTLGEQAERVKPPTTTERAAPPKRGRRVAAPAGRPPIKRWLIPFPEKRVSETATYSQRHYGKAVSDLDPQAIVEHYTVFPTAQQVYDRFAADVPDAELKELPGVCSHYLVDRDGTIFELVPPQRICRHTVGLNDVAIGIEHVGGSDAEVLGNKRQLSASLQLTAWLRCRHGIELENVIGHNESLGSPLHHENVPALRSQTHDDFKRASMDGYRARLGRRGCPP